MNEKFVLPGVVKVNQLARSSYSILELDTERLTKIYKTCTKFLIQ